MRRPPFPACEPHSLSGYFPRTRAEVATRGARSTDFLMNLLRFQIHWPMYFSFFRMNWMEGSDHPLRIGPRRVSSRGKGTCSAFSSKAIDTAHSRRATRWPASAGWGTIRRSSSRCRAMTALALTGSRFKGPSRSPSLWRTSSGVNRRCRGRLGTSYSVLYSPDSRAAVGKP